MLFSQKKILHSNGYVYFFVNLNMYLQITLKAVDATVNSLHLSECF